MNNNTDTTDPVEHQLNVLKQLEEKLNLARKLKRKGKLEIAGGIVMMVIGTVGIIKVIQMTKEED